MKLDPVKLAHLARGLDGMAERIDYWVSERMPAPPTRAGARKRPAWSRLAPRRRPKT